MFTIYGSGTSPREVDGQNTVTSSYGSLPMQCPLSLFLRKLHDLSGLLVGASGCLRVLSVGGGGGPGTRSMGAKSGGQASSMPF